jgi:hypothetical protein
MTTISLFHPDMNDENKVRLQLKRRPKMNGIDHSRLMAINN